MPPIPDHLIWYAIFWALLMSPFYLLSFWTMIFLWNNKDTFYMFVQTLIMVARPLYFVDVTDNVDIQKAEVPVTMRRKSEEIKKEG